MLLCISGLWLDHMSNLSQSILETGFYISGVIGLFVVTIYYISKNRTLWKNSLLVLLALIVWRIAYFPIMVLAGYVATWGEAVSIAISDYSVVYPFLFLSVALMNALCMIVSGGVLHFVLNLNQYFKKSLDNTKLNSPNSSKNSKLMLVSLTTFTGIVVIPLVVLAVGVSFTQPADWHAIPDTSILDDKPLPMAALPEMNPYASALDKPNLSWQHKVLFKAAEITYDYIPENTRWSQVVKGTLEKEFVETTEISTAFCTKVHLRAFMTAQPFLNGKESIDDL